MSGLKQFFAKTLSLTAYDLCDLQAVENDHTFVTADGYYCSAISLDGAKTHLGESEHPKAVQKLNDRLNASFKSPGHQIQIVFIQDPEEGGAYVAKKQVDELRFVANRLSLNIEPILKERESIWRQKRVPFEACYVVVKTSLAAFSKADQDRAIKERELTPFVVMGQDPRRGYKRLLAKHSSFVKNLAAAFADVCVAEPMTVHQLARAINTFITGRYDDRFQLRQTQSKKAVPPRLQVSKENPSDPTPLSQPPIAFQFWTERPKELDDEESLVKCHNRYIAPIQIETWSDRPQPFTELVSRIERRMPFAASFTFQTGKDQVRTFLNSSHRMAMLAKMFNKANGEQASAATILRDYLVGNEANALKGHLTLSTWAKSKDLCLTRKEELSSAVSSWCGLRPVEFLDDPVRLWIEGIPGMARKPVSIPSAIRLKDALAYLPIDRPASFFKSGAMPLFSTDYKPMPFMMGAPFQTTWNNNWFAPPGSGKSVGLFGSTLALLLSEENKQLPKQVFLDVGHAGVGLVKLFKSILGPERAHRAHYFTMRNDGKTFINPFDTMTCNRYPTDQEKQDLISLLGIIFATEDGADSKYLELIIPDLINKMYELRSDRSGGKGDPSLYKRHQDAEIDARLDEGDIKLDEQPLWWEIADALLYAGEYRLANRATRQAVPLLRDINTIIAKDDDLKRKFADVTIGSVPLLEYIRIFTESTISNVVLLNAPTNIDLTETDLLVVNLADVVSTDDATGRKQSATMFMLAMVAGAREFFQTPEVVKSPVFSDDPAVKSYHLERLKANFNTKRHLILDEYHQFNSIPSLDNRIISARRKGRKNNLIISLATQYDYHVTEEQREIATNTFFMSANDRPEMNSRQERYKFSDDIKEFALKEQRGPGTMLHFAKKKENSTWQVCRDVKGPMELWAFSSTNSDLDLRDALEDKVGFWEACRILGENFPGGSIGDFHHKFTRYVQATFKDPEATKRWHQILAKKILMEPDSWRLSISEEIE